MAVEGKGLREGCCFSDGEGCGGEIAEKGGEVKSVGLWGRRTLSYPIKKYSEGAYYLARFSIDAAAAPEINRALDSDQSVLRHLLVKEERKKAVKAES